MLKTLSQTVVTGLAGSLVSPQQKHQYGLYDTTKPWKLHKVWTYPEFTETYAANIYSFFASNQNLIKHHTVFLRYGVN